MQNFWSGKSVCACAEGLKSKIWQVWNFAWHLYTALEQRWNRIWSVGVDSGRILHVFRTRILTRSQKFVKNRFRSHVSILGVAGVCVVISLVKAWLNYGWMDDCSRSLNRSRILKFEKLPDPHTDSKIFEPERSRSLKKWLRPAAMDPECRSRLRKDSAFFFRTRIRTRSQKFGKNRNRSHFSIRAVAGVCKGIS